MKALTAASTLVTTKQKVLTPQTLTPESSAARGLPPTA
jgi:hypothetical protein